MDLIIKQNELEQRWLVKWTQKPQRKKKAYKPREGGWICQEWCKGLEAPNDSGGTKVLLSQACKQQKSLN